MKFHYGKTPENLRGFRIEEMRNSITFHNIL